MQARWQRPPSYHTVHEEGPEHKKVFTVQVSVLGQALGSGIGPSKQEAEREAARQALTDLTGETQPPEPAVSLEDGAKKPARTKAPRAGQGSAPALRVPQGGFAPPLRPARGRNGASEACQAVPA